MIGGDSPRRYPSTTLTSGRGSNAAQRAITDILLVVMMVDDRAMLTLIVVKERKIGWSMLLSKGVLRVKEPW